MTYYEVSYQNITTQDCCFKLRRVTRAVTQFYDHHLAASDIRSTQYTLLLILASGSGKTLTEMAESLLMHRTTLSRNLRPLSKAGLIITKPLKDKRRKEFVLTEKGGKAIQSAMPLWKKAQDSLIGQVGFCRLMDLLEELKLLIPLTKAPIHNCSL